MFTLPFIYEGNEYTALIHEKYIGAGIEYRVTIMNGELESLLYGHHIITELNGVIMVDQTGDEKRQLLNSVKDALSNHLQEGLIY